ncbi:hypothetical protein MKW94_027143 [Papaver nudicaule]|uniref:Uncharacterized protein n=1 Tax=Papaver nudicaule TaxID=74823 RepID=A0AA41S4M5_PAPNU|nr:hypothetical protein [Papaver nudicaule]
MSNSKVHSQGSVPFSWENQPGVSKKTYREDSHDDGYYKQLLPPPPCPPILDSPAKTKIDLKIPLPPCPLQYKLSRSNSTCSRKGGLKRSNEDPFFAAYKECTKTKSRFTRTTKSSGFGMFSCKNSCGVNENSLIKSHHRQQQKQVYSPTVLRERVSVGK